MKVETHTLDTLANGLPEWAQIGMLLGFVAVLVLRFWLDPRQIGAPKRRRNHEGDRK